MPQRIMDLIYFDFAKAASIYSQFEGGLRERVSVTEDMGKDRNAGVSVGVPKLAEAKLGVEYIEKTSILETRILHHDLLVKVESKLHEMQLVTDLGAMLSQSESSPEKIRDSIGDRPYIKAAGWSVFEDYRHILSISERFNDITKFIAQCGVENAKQTPEYLELKNEIEEARKNLSSIKDRNQKAVVKSQLKALEQTLGDIVTPNLTPVDQYILDGIQLWIKTFMPNRINFRVYPFEQCPSFQVLCNLKRECFVDQDLEHLLYGYGNRPNVPIAVFGLITSLPARIDEMFDPMTEFEEAKEEAEEEAEKIGFEKGFRAVFGAMDSMEAFMRYSRYPNVTVHPIAVFRQFESPSHGKDD